MSPSLARALPGWQPQLLSRMWPVSNCWAQLCDSVPRTGRKTHGFTAVDMFDSGLPRDALEVTLAEEGLKVLVLESRSILGGRARSWVDGAA